jgi:hypothetical protein
MIGPRLECGSHRQSIPLSGLTWSAKLLHVDLMRAKIATNQYECDACRLGRLQICEILELDKYTCGQRLPWPVSATLLNEQRQTLASLLLERTSRVSTPVFSSRGTFISVSLTVLTSPNISSICSSDLPATCQPSASSQLNTENATHLSSPDMQRQTRVRRVHL